MYYSFELLSIPNFHDFLTQMRTNLDVDLKIDVKFIN